MAGRRQQGRRGAGPGWLATLAGVFLLIVVGFGIGLVSGALFEEPGLVMEHLAGHTRSLPLPAQEAAAPAAASPAVASPAPAAAPAPPAEAARPSVAAAPPTGPRAASGRYVIQVGAFGSRQSAEALLRTLRSAGLAGYVAEEAGGAVPYKVRVGPFGSRKEADAVALRLKREKQLPTWVLSRDPK